MRNTKKIEWSKLDNASKIFPAICSDRDNKVFRISCELFEPVNAEILQKALDTTIQRFPLYRSVLRRGVFWYFFEKSDIRPVVEKEILPVCTPIYRKDSRNLLFRVLYYNKRIHLEVFHALSDGTGALWFFKTLVFYYLSTKHRNKLSEDTLELDYKASISEKMDDSFIRYYKGKNQKPISTKSKSTTEKGYQIKGSRLDENRINVIEGTMSVKSVLEHAHNYNTTLTIFLSALLIYAIYQDMPERKKNLPIVLQIPVDLRKFFKSETSRNFFSTMDIKYRCEDENVSLGEIIESVAKSFKNDLTKEQLGSHLNWQMSLETSLYTRIIPLPLKNYLLRLAVKLIERDVTATVSNVGQIHIPAELEKYIKQFVVLPNVKRSQLAVCTFGDQLVLSFVSPFSETEVQRTFFTYLAKLGIKIEIASNI